MTKNEYKNIELRFKRVKELKDTLLESKLYFTNQIIIDSLESNVRLTLRDLELEVDIYN